MTDDILVMKGCWR